MNAKQLIAAVALIATGVTTGSVAFAADHQVGGEAYVSFPIPSMTKTKTDTVSNGKTRAEVVAELSQARAAGVPVGGEAYVSFAPAKTQRPVVEATQISQKK